MATVQTPQTAQNAPITSLQAPIKYNDNIYFGCKEHLTENFLRSSGVNLIINLMGFDIGNTDDTLYINNYADIVNMSLLADELMPDELERGRTKIANIVTKLISFVNDGATVMLLCNTGVNKSPVVIGYYMLKAGLKPCTILSTINSWSSEFGLNLLTNQSFKKILHPRSPTCKCWEPVVVVYRPQENID